MAENEDGQERSEEATPKRQQEARKKGQIPRSRELTTMAMLLMAAVCLSLMGSHMIEQLGAVLKLGLQVDRSKLFDTFAMIEILGQAVYHGFLLTIPFLLVMLVTALTAPIALGGWSAVFHPGSFSLACDDVPRLSRAACGTGPGTRGHRGVR